MKSLICDAIRERQVIRFDYDGGTREAEPHCYGQSKSGNDLLRAYQVSGFSQSGDSTGWKLFRVDQMASLSMTGETFPGSRAGYDRFDDAMVRVHCRL